jgi:ribosomal protein S1
MVQDRVKGGLVVDLGIRGFVPASHVGTGSLKNNLDRYVGQSIPLKVIEVDKERRKVVLSNKLAVAEEREVRSAETKNSLSAGQIRHGVVRRLTNYGAFVDLGGIDGLLHISEMSWTRINDPKEILREGQELDVIILKMDLENNRVSLGLRQILPDPWSEIKDRYKEGDVITGTVTRLVPFGAFVQVEGGVEGIIPSSELPRNRGKAGAPLAPNEEITVKLISLRPEERKMTLSLRALQPPEEREQAPAREASPRETTPREPAAPREGGREPSSSSGGKRSRSDRDDRGDDYARFTPGRQQEEPRFNAFGEAYSAAKRNKKDRRVVAEEYDEDYLLDEEVVETDVEVPEVTETEGEETA